MRTKVSSDLAFSSMTARTPTSISIGSLRKERPSSKLWLQTSTSHSYSSAATLGKELAIDYMTNSQLGKTDTREELAALASSNT